MSAVSERVDSQEIPNRSTKKLWELDDRVHCSLIGTCLSLAELRRICRKAKISFKTPVSDYGLHTYIVNGAAEKSHLTQLMQKHLDFKFRLAIQRFSRVSQVEDLVSLWRNSVDGGEIAGAYWALATHRRTPEKLMWSAFGEVHMLSHLSGASLRVDAQQLVKLGERVPELERELENTRATAFRKQHLLRETIESLQKELAESQQAVRGLKCDLDDIRGQTTRGVGVHLEEQTTDYANRYAKLSARVRASEEQIEKWKDKALRRDDRCQGLELENAELKSERDALEKIIEQVLMSGCGDCSVGEQSVNGADLQGRCILYVGGRTGQNVHFRALVERSNGQFMYHDGGREDSRSQLGSVLSKADIVVCPLDCVSHAAVGKVKRHCERYMKQLVLLPRASLSAFARGLNELPA